MSARVDVAELLARARARGAAGDLEAAEGALRQVLAAEPRNPQALHLLGITRWHAGDVAGALAPLREAAALAPRSAETRYALGRVSQILAEPGDTAFACRCSGRELHVLTVDHCAQRARVRA